MRPLRLDLAGFTVFREPTTIDFTDAEFFALVGPTGSGKSTVLDAICFALYGTVPRWADRRGVANALAPSAAEARVRLVFGSGEDRYVATRVVRRTGKAGRVETSHAGLERLPAGFDLAAFDGGLDGADLGEVLAGTPAEMEPAVLAAVGLPYEQFTTCVVLPQGEFAEFLHARPAARQEILVNLLGLHVYEQVRLRAADLAQRTEWEVAGVDRRLAELAGADDTALAAAEQRVAALRTLAADVDAAMPALAAAEGGARDAAERLAELDARQRALRAVRQPADAGRTAGQVAAAQAAARQAADDVGAAEAAEDEVRAAVAAAGDVARLRRLLDAYAETERLAAELSALDQGSAEAAAEHAAARAAAAETAEALAAATGRHEAARTEHLAATLRPHLEVGAPCPVCTQPVTGLPLVPDVPELAAAEDALATARARAARADAAVTDLDHVLTAARARRDTLADRRDALAAQLAGAPDRAALATELAAVEDLTKRLDAAAADVRTARTGHRRAAAEAERATAALTAAWQAFDATRDAIAALEPPPPDRADLGGSWERLAGWAADRLAGVEADRAEAHESASTAARAVDETHARIGGLFTAYGIAAPRPGEAPAYRSAAAVAVERADAERRELVRSRELADKLRAERTGYEQDARVARALANHLKANNFERWLLAEALDALVDGASRILRQLSGGQYELVHDKGDFAVVDHHDADLRRAVRTLSGGETFQASLALALALSEQLAGMSTASAALGSIVLDEGFGTLDAATLDVVAATLESLAARGDRMVGVVTHVPALAERIPVRYEVRKDSRSARVTRVST